MKVHCSLSWQVVQVIVSSSQLLAPKDMPLLLSPGRGGRNSSLLTLLHPASTQRRIQGYGRFVHKDELEIVSEGLFFQLFQQFCRFGFSVLVLQMAQVIFGPANIDTLLRFNSARKATFAQTYPGFLLQVGP